MLPIQMKALQRHYVIAEKREYAKDETFTVNTDQEAARLEKLRRAVRVPDEKQKPPPPEHKEEHSKEDAPRHRPYRRRDMVPE